jgi:hypothetical protein
MRFYNVLMNQSVRTEVNRDLTSYTKLEFLPVFKTPFTQLFTSANICSAFQDAYLVPFQPHIVLPKLDVQLCTPTPAALLEVIWEAHTLSNVREPEAQSTLIRNCMRQHKSLSSASIIEAIGQLEKGAEVVMVSAELMHY